MSADSKDSLSGLLDGIDLSGMPPELRAQLGSGGGGGGDSTAATTAMVDVDPALLASSGSSGAFDLSNLGAALSGTSPPDTVPPSAPTGALADLGVDASMLGDVPPEIAAMMALASGSGSDAAAAAPSTSAAATPRSIDGTPAGTPRVPPSIEPDNAVSDAAAVPELADQEPAAAAAFATSPEVEHAAAADATTVAAAASATVAAAASATPSAVSTSCTLLPATGQADPQVAQTGASDVDRSGKAAAAEKDQQQEEQEEKEDKQQQQEEEEEEVKEYRGANPRPRSRSGSSRSRKSVSTSSKSKSVASSRATSPRPVSTITSRRSLTAPSPRLASAMSSRRSLTTTSPRPASAKSSRRSLTTSSARLRAAASSRAVAGDGADLAARSASGQRSPRSQGSSSLSRPASAPLSRTSSHVRSTPRRRASSRRSLASAASHSPPTPDVLLRPTSAMAGDGRPRSNTESTEVSSGRLRTGSSASAYYERPVPRPQPPGVLATNMAHFPKTWLDDMARPMRPDTSHGSCVRRRILANRARPYSRNGKCFLPDMPLAYQHIPRQSLAHQPDRRQRLN